MNLTFTQSLIIVFAIAAATFAERLLPFLVFSGDRIIPLTAKYLGKVLPPAMSGVLVVYCLKNVSFMPSSFDWKTALSLGAIILLHLWKRNTILCVFGGTAVYMVLSYFF